MMHSKPASGRFFSLALAALLLIPPSLSPALQAQETTGRGEGTAAGGTPGPAETGRAPTLQESEIRVPRVRFINRSNRLASEERMDQDYALGDSLAKEVVASGHGEQNDIEIRRIYDPEHPAYGADVIFIKPRADIGHVNTIQRILRGYLSQAFEYNKEDAETLGRFLLYYNARLRGDMKLINAKYSPGVVKILNPEYAGIDRSYRNWPGKTEILLPLKKNVVRPGKMDLNNGELQKEAVKAPPADQKKMEQLQEKRKAEDTVKLDQKEKDLTRQEQQLAQKTEELQQKKEDLTKQVQKSEEKIQELAKNPQQNAAEIQKEQAKKEDLAKQEQQTASLIQKTGEEKKQVQSEKQEVQQQKDEMAGKTPAKAAPAPAPEAKTAQTPPPPSPEQVAALKQENQQLKQQMKEEKEKSPNVVGDKILFLRVLQYIEAGHYNNELWMVDPVHDDALYRGPYTSICGRNFLVVPEAGVLVIGYEAGHHTDSQHHLIMLQKDRLDLKSLSKEEVFWRSPLIERDGKIYAFEIYNGEHYLSRFNLDLTLDVRSSEPISANSDITFYKDKVYVTGKAQTKNATTISVFALQDLKHTKTIEPPESAARQ